MTAGLVLLVIFDVVMLQQGMSRCIRPVLTLS